MGDNMNEKIFECLMELCNELNFDETNPKHRRVFNKTYKDIQELFKKTTVRYIRKPYDREGVI